MYNIVIFSGGTGSIALQEGFSAIYGNDNYNIDIIINAYDNGKSTGACRKIFNNMILGPSDLRKNHMVQFKLQHKKEIEDFTSREAVLYRLFNMRIDGENKEEYYAKSCDIIDGTKDKLSRADVEYLMTLLDFFFFEDKEYKPVAHDNNIRRETWRNTLDKINFHNFSIANIFYTSEAVKNDYSLRIAGKRLANFLNIKDNVHLISDVNLFLGAKTESGEFIIDEGDIVKWNNPLNRITSVVLMKDNEEYIPSVDEETDITKVRSVKSIITEADIIIFSSGTQWSSLIPSYMHSGLRKLLDFSKAKKYIIINNVDDQDMKGVTADEIIDLIDKYVPMNEFVAVVNEDAAEGMNKVNKIESIYGHIGGDNCKHNPIKLVKLLMNDFFCLDRNDYTFIFDLDGTLWDERANNKGKAVGADNLNLFHGIVHSGNNYEHVRDVFKYLYHQDNVVQIYSDFGNVHFNSDDFNKELLCNEFIIDESVVGELEKINDFKGKIKIRGEGCVITIKPLINRRLLIEKAKECLKKYKGKYVAYISGHTSIDIMHKNYSKKTMLPIILKNQQLSINDIIFVGNELDYGAETGIKELSVKTIQVDDVFECNVLLRTILY